MAQQTSVSDFPFLNRTNLVSFKSCDSYGLPPKRQELHFERYPLFVHMDNGADISSFQPVVRHFFLYRHSVMFFDHKMIVGAIFYNRQDL